jgi:hypothetical protein
MIQATAEPTATLPAGSNKSGTFHWSDCTAQEHKHWAKEFSEIKQIIREKAPDVYLAGHWKRLAWFSATPPVNLDESIEAHYIKMAMVNALRSKALEWDVLSVGSCANRDRIVKLSEKFYFPHRTILNPGICLITRAKA